MGAYSKFHLQPVGKAFRYRRRVPTSLVCVLGVTEWSKYLGQLGARDAIVEARKLDVEHDALIGRIEKLSPTERAAIAAKGGLRSFRLDQQCDEIRLELAGEFFGSDADPSKVNLDAPDAIVRLKAIRHHEAYMAEARAKNTVKRAVVAKINGASPTAAMDALIETWKEKAKPRNPKTVQKMELYVRRLADAIGPMTPRSIQRAHIVKFRAALEANEELSLSPDAVQQHLNFLHRLFGVAASENLMDANPVQGVKANKPAGAKFSDEEGRKPFQPDQVRAIFKAMAAENADTQWIIKLLAYHGMRSGEVAQLRCEDVTTLSGIPVLRVHDKHGSLKNRFSLRDVPIHPECMGIVEFAAKVAALGTEPWLFQTYAKTIDKGGKFQRWGGKFLRAKAKIADTDLTMHSLRHTWRTCAREIGMPPPVSRAIMGHSMGKGHHDDYGEPPSLRLRADWMAKVNPVA